MFNNRVKTAIVLIPLMLGGIYLLPLAWFGAFIGVIAVLGAWEWSDLSGYPSTRARVFYATSVAILLAVMYAGIEQGWLPVNGLLLVGVVWWALGWWLVKRYPDRPGWSSPQVRLLMGYFILGTMWVGFYWIRREDPSRLLITLLMLLVWGADIGAYYVGRALGKTPLAPDVSPGKTWEGVLGGTVMAAIVVLIVVLVFVDRAQWSALDYLILFSLSALVVAISIVGDLVESMVKRYRGLKDSGRLLPGHGGIMDRIDSMCAAAPVFAACLALWSGL